MRPRLLHFRAHPHLLAAAAFGLGAALLLPSAWGAVTRALGGWNVAVWTYLALVLAMMLRADHARLRRLARLQAEGALTVLVAVVLAALASLAGIVVELSAVKQQGVAQGAGHLLFALATVAGSWLLLPTLFALTYASRYYGDGDGDGDGGAYEDGAGAGADEGAGARAAEVGCGGLEFPRSGRHFMPDYADFMYFAFTIAVASQTADVAVSTRPMRRLVLLQSLLSFAFNTAILAFTINMAAGMF